MKVTLTGVLVKSSLAAHSAVGLCVGALMYLICLTGSLAVFVEELQRWEQPDVPEFHTFDSTTVEAAMNGFIRRTGVTPDALYVMFPTTAMPRMHVADNDSEWFLKRDGSLAQQPKHAWSEMVSALHVHLHIPANIGIILVSSLGAMLIGLIISGLLAHPRILKDAFRLRLGGSRRLEQADIHNRLSVWGLPFHLMIAVTGAMFGLIGVLMMVAVPAFYNGDREALLADVYGADPVLDAPVQALNVNAALHNFKVAAPNADPLYLVAHKSGTRAQYMEIAATLPGRLIYSEIYRFDVNGEYLGKQGLSDGIAGRQIIYSIYRIHFGQFGGLIVKIAYLLLGLALTVVSVSGINIWLARRGGRDWVNDLWCATVWGTPLALSLTAFCTILFDAPAIGVFIASLIGTSLLSLRLKDTARSGAYLKRGCAILLLALVGGYSAQFPHHLGNSLVLAVNGTLLLTAVLIFYLAKPSLLPLKRAQSA